MKHFFHLVFFHIYRFTLTTPSRDTAMASTITAIAFTIGTNILSIYILLSISGIVSYVKIKTPVTVAVYVIISILSYLYIKPKKDEILKREFSNHTKEELKKSSRAVLIYCLGSILLVFILAPLRVM